MCMCIAKPVLLTPHWPPTMQVISLQLQSLHGPLTIIPYSAMSRVLMHHLTRACSLYPTALSSYNNGLVVGNCWLITNGMLILSGKGDRFPHTSNTAEFLKVISRIFTALVRTFAKYYNFLPWKCLYDVCKSEFQTTWCIICLLFSSTWVRYSSVD